MKKSYKFLLLLCSLFSVSLCGLFSTQPHQTEAVSSKSTAFSDNFNNSSFNSSWINKNASIGQDYRSLSVIDWDVWQPSVNLLNYKIEADSTIMFDINFISGQWGGICFGLPKETSRFCYASCAIFMYQEKTWMEIQNEVGELSAEASSGIPNINKSCFAGLNVLSTVKMDCYADKSITISAAKKGEQLQTIGTFEPYKNQGFQPGYIGFAGMGKATYDIVNFKYIKNGLTVFEDDFSSSLLGTTSTGTNGFDWFVSYYYGETNTRIGPSGYLKLENSSYVLFDKELENNHISKNQFEMSFKFMIDTFDIDDIFGVGFGLDSSSDSIMNNEFIGIIKDNIGFSFISYSQGYSTKGDNINLNSGLFYNVTISGTYSNQITLTISGNGTREENTFTINFEGKHAIGSYSGNSSSLVRVDDYFLNVYNFNSSKAKDVAINFSGTVSEYDAEEDYTYHDYYVNNYEYYIGPNVVHLPYMEDRQGNRITDNDKLSFSSRQNDVASMGVFAPKYMYSNSIIRFDIQMNNSSKNDLKNSRIGVGFGMKSTYFYPVNTPYFFFQKTDNETLVGGRGMTPVIGNSKEHLNNNGVNNYYKSSYNLWNGDTTTIYNLMLVVENGNVKVYYKANYQPDSMLKILRCEFEGADTYGYVSIFSYDGASFFLNNFSVTNIDSFKNDDGSISGFEFKNSTIQNNKLILNNQSLTSKNEYSDAVALFKLKGKNGSSLDIDFADKHLSLQKNYIEGETYLRIKLFDGKFEICLRHDGPEDDLYTPLLNGTFDNSSFFKLSIKAIGEVEVFSSTYISLESSIEIPLGDYDPEYEKQFIRNVPRDSITKSKLELINVSKKTLKKNVKILFIVSGVVVVMAAVLIPILLVRRKKLNNIGG